MHRRQLLVQIRHLVPEPAVEIASRSLSSGRAERGPVGSQ
jgi:hypothetical protein